MTSFRIGQEVEVTRTYFSLEWQPNGECRRRPHSAETLVARVVKKIDGNPLVAWKSPTGVDEEDETEENDVDARAIFVFLFDAKSGKVLDASPQTTYEMRIDPIGTRRAGKKAVYTRETLVSKLTCPPVLKVGDLVDFSSSNGTIHGSWYTENKPYKIKQIRASGSFVLENQHGVAFCPPLKLVAGILTAYQTSDGSRVVFPTVVKAKRKRVAVDTHEGNIERVYRYTLNSDSVDPWEWHVPVREYITAKDPRTGRIGRLAWNDQIVARGQGSIVTKNEYGDTKEIPVNRKGTGVVRSSYTCESFGGPREIRTTTDFYVPFRCST